MNPTPTPGPPSRRPLSLRSLALLLALTASTACQVHEHRIGGGATGIGQDSSRQFYMLFGLLPLNDVNVQRMAVDVTSYDIRSAFSLTDLLLSPLLLPLTMTSRTVTVYR